MLDDAARIVLSFSHDTIILPLLILGYIFLNRELFYGATCLILTSMLFNYALKITFKVPLSPEIGEGFAFPSGHMQSAVVLYGWLISKTRNVILKATLLALLVVIGLSLMHFGYHNFPDILGAIFFALLLMFSYQYLLNKKEKALKFIIITFCSLLLFYITSVSAIKGHLWMAYYAVIGVTLSHELFVKDLNITDLKTKISAAIFCLSLFYIIKLIFALQAIATMSAFLKQTQWFLIGFNLPFSVFIANNIYVRFRNIYNRT